MKALIITLVMIAIIAVGSLSLILAINYETDNLKNNVKKIEMENNTTVIESVEKIPEIQKYPETTILRLDDERSIKNTTIILNIPKNNTLPYAHIKGNVLNPAEGYPVILQIYKSLKEGPIHIAQVDLNEDNKFEYSFRILSINDGITIHLYEGDYFVKVIKVVNIHSPKDHR